MTTEDQIKANRLNSQKSTGPRSQEGKRRSSRNATRHGLLAKEVVVSGESAQEFMELRRKALEALKPANILEERLVERVVACLWRLDRSLKMESFMLGKPLDPIDRSLFNPSDEAADRFSSRHGFFQNLNRYEVAIERSLYRALIQLARYRMERGGGSVMAPVLVQIDTTDNIDS